MKKKRRLSRFKARQTTGGLVSRPNEIATRKSSKEMLDHNGDAMDDGLAAAMRLAKQTVLASSKPARIKRMVAPVGKGRRARRLVGIVSIVAIVAIVGPDRCQIVHEWYNTPTGCVV